MWKTWIFFRFRPGAARDWMFKLVFFHPTPLVWWQTLLFGSGHCGGLHGGSKTRCLLLICIRVRGLFTHFLCVLVLIFLCRTRLRNQYTKTNNSPLYYRCSNSNFLAFLSGFSVHCFLFFRICFFCWFSFDVVKSCCCFLYQFSFSVVVTYHQTQLQELNDPFKNVLPYVLARLSEWTCFVASLSNPSAISSWKWTTKPLFNIFYIWHGEWTTQKLIRCFCWGTSLQRNLKHSCDTLFKAKLTIESNVELWGRTEKKCTVQGYHTSYMLAFQTELKHISRKLRNWTTFRQSFTWKTMQQFQNRSSFV